MSVTAHSAHTLSPRFRWFESHCQITTDTPILRTIARAATVALVYTCSFIVVCATHSVSLFTLTPFTGSVRVTVCVYSSTYSLSVARTHNERTTNQNRFQRALRGSQQQRVDCDVKERKIKLQHDSAEQ